MTGCVELTKQYIEISRQMSIKHKEARNLEHTLAERRQAQSEYHCLQETLLLVMWKMEMV